MTPFPSSRYFLPTSIIALMVVGLGLWGCDTASGPGPSLEEREATSKMFPQKSNTQRTPPQKHVDRLTKNVSVRGPLKPGRPVKITLTATSHLQTEEVKARLFLPELTILREGERAPGQPAVLPVEEKIPAAAKFNRGMGKGQSVRRRVTVRPEEPGYYMVSAAVWASEAENLTEGRIPVDNGQSREFWLWISEEGGMITPTFDPSLFPEDYHVTPGPLTKKRQTPTLRVETNTDSSSGRGSLRAKNGGSDLVKIKFTRFDPIEGRLEPIVGDFVDVEEEDQYGSGQNNYTTTITNSDGTLVFGCDQYSSTEITAELHSDRGGIVVHNNSGSTVAAMASTFEAACGTVTEARASASQYFVWKEMRRIKNRSENFYGGLSRSSIPVFLNKDLGTSRYTVERPSGNDYIQLSGDTYETSNLSERDIRTMAHEYGHAFHEKAIGGYAVEGSCPEDGHYLSGAHDLDCAFQEGYAQFHAAITVADTNDFDEVIENAPDNYVYPANFGEGTPTDGSIIEGTVAAFLYDLTDPKNESHDDLNFPGKYVADVIGTCGGQANGGGFFEANGADHLVACFQLENPPYDEKYNGANYYFGTRSYSLRADGYVTESATEPSGWNRSDIKEIWHYTLYKDTP